MIALAPESLVRAPSSLATHFERTIISNMTGKGKVLIRTIKPIPAFCVFFFGLILTSVGQDLPNSKDPAG